MYFPPQRPWIGPLPLSPGVVTPPVVSGVDSHRPMKTTGPPWSIYAHLTKYREILSRVCQYFAPQTIYTETPGKCSLRIFVLHAKESCQKP